MPRRPDSVRAASSAARAQLPTLGLLGVTAAWGSTFYLLKDVLVRVPVGDFLAVRFGLAALAVWLLAPRCIARLSPAARRQGVVLGAVYGAAQLLQTVGLQTTAASVSGFLTGMYVVFTPLLAALVLRARLGATVWAAVLLATLGLGLLSLQGLAISGGAALTLASAVLYAVHIIGLGAWSRGTDAIGLTVVQLLVITIVCGLAAARGGVQLPARTGDWVALLYMALVAGALALVVQTWAQAQLAPTRAAIVMTMEPVWAAGFAAALGGERLGPRVVLGGAMVLAAMLVVELRGDRNSSDAATPTSQAVGAVVHIGPV